MNMVRTTITLPEDLHEELRLLSIRKKKSLSTLVIDKFKGEFEKEGVEKINIKKTATDKEFNKWLEGAMKEDAKILNELA